MANEYPCTTCRRVPKPNNCENKSCKVWREWFLQKWAELHKGKPQRLIDANVFFEKLKKQCELMIRGKIASVDIDLLMLSIPPVDAVAVVRCKHCKKYYESATGSDDCMLLCISVKPDDFCSFGERRDGE